MKKKGILHIALWCLTFSCFGQKIQYSRETVRSSQVDAVELVSLGSGAQHLICFMARSKPVIHVYDGQLRLQGKTELGEKINADDHIKILPLDRYYFIYRHTPGTNRHSLLKVDTEGTVLPYTDNLKQTVDSVLFGSSNSLHFEQMNGYLYLISHHYFEAVRQVQSTLVKLDENCLPLQVEKVVFEFDIERDILEQVDVTGNDLQVLINRRDSEGDNRLDLIRISTTTGESIGTSFSSGKNRYLNPYFLYDKTDSTTTVVSVIREPGYGAGLQRALFVGKLDSTLKAIVPVAVLPSLVKDNTAGFVLLDGPRPLWVSVQAGMWLQRLRGSAATVQLNQSPGVYGPRNFFSRVRPGEVQMLLNPAYVAPFRLHYLDAQLKIGKDSTVKNENSVQSVKSFPFAQASIAGRNYLVLMQQFSPKKRGLVLISKEADGQFQATDVPVYDRFEYLLGQLKSVKNNYFILPYRKGRDLGLVKYTFRDDLYD